MLQLRTQQEIRSFLNLQEDIQEMTRPLEEESEPDANDFFWRIRRIRNRGSSTYNFIFTGSRTVTRVQRELLEPDPNRPERTRRVIPDLSNSEHYGREVPSNY